MRRDVRCGCTSCATGGIIGGMGVGVKLEVVERGWWVVRCVVGRVQGCVLRVAGCVLRGRGQEAWVLGRETGHGPAPCGEDRIRMPPMAPARLGWVNCLANDSTERTRISPQSTQRTRRFPYELCALGGLCGKEGAFCTGVIAGSKKVEEKA